MKTSKEGYGIVERKCPVCGDALIGRTDKKYCSDQCRFVSNSKKKQLNEKPIIDANQRLRRNRMVLKTLCPAGKCVVRREVMEALGYEVTLFTSIFVTGRKQIYYLCYDYGYMPIIQNGVEKAMIISRQPYMQDWQPWKYVRNEDTLPDPGGP
jgi:hypothetical protein